MRTEKSRLRRSLMSLRELMRCIRHDTIKKQVGEINAVLRGHYAYYGIAGNIRALFKVYRAVERYWRKMLCSRSWAGRSPDLGRFQPNQGTDPVYATQTASSLSGVAGPRGAVNQSPKSVVREIRTPRSVGTGGGRPPPVTRWARRNPRPYRDPSNGSGRATATRRLSHQTSAQESAQLLNGSLVLRDC